MLFNYRRSGQCRTRWLLTSGILTNWKAKDLDKNVPTAVDLVIDWNFSSLDDEALFILMNLFSKLDQDKKNLLFPCEIESKTSILYESFELEFTFPATGIFKFISQLTDPVNSQLS